MCILCAYYTLLNVVCHYHLSALSMSVMGFQKILDRDVSSIHFFNFLFCKLTK